MPIDTYKSQAFQDAKETEDDTTIAPGHYERPHFELDQHPLNVAPRDLMERDFSQAAMHPEARRAAEDAWDLQERQDLDLKMFDEMNEEQSAARSQVAEVRRESDVLAPGVTEEMVRAWSDATKIQRNGEISKALEGRRLQALSN